jgi:hypothetical protein
MTAKTRRLRELLAVGEFLYMPSAATPLEGRLAEAMGTPLVYTGGLCQRPLSEAEFTALRKEIGLDAYYRSNRRVPRDNGCAARLHRRVTCLRVALAPPFRGATFCPIF